MALTTQELIDLIDTKIEDLVNSPEVNYKIGDKSLSAGQKMKQLKEMRASLLEGADAEAVFVAFDVDITEFGEDKSQVQK